MVSKLYKKSGYENMLFKPTISLRDFVIEGLKRELQSLAKLNTTCRIKPTPENLNQFKTRLRDIAEKYGFGRDYFLINQEKLVSAIEMRILEWIEQIKQCILTRDHEQFKIIKKNINEEDEHARLSYITISNRSFDYDVKTTLAHLRCRLNEIWKTRENCVAKNVRESWEKQCLNEDIDRMYKFMLW